MRGSLRSIVVTALLIPATGACFKYVAPTRGMAVPSGSVVRVAIRPEWADSLALEVGPRVAMVAGHLESDADGVLAVRGETVTRLDGADDLAGATVVHIPRRYVGSVEVRRFDRLRSALIVGGIVAATVTVRAAGSSAGGASGGGSTGGK